MWAYFSSAGSLDVSQDIFTRVTSTGASSRAHHFSSQVGMGSSLQDLSGEEFMMPMISSFVVGTNVSSVT